MVQNSLLSAFTSLVQKTDEPLLFQFKEIQKGKGESRPPLTEILNAEYQGKIRFFELDYVQSASIVETFLLPRQPGVVISHAAVGGTRDAHHLSGNEVLSVDFSL